jgi:hypothetical protein
MAEDSSHRVHLLSSSTTVYAANLEPPNHTATPPYPVMVIFKTAFSYLFDNTIQIPLVCNCIPASSMAQFITIKTFELCPYAY